MSHTSSIASQTSVETLLAASRQLDVLQRQDPRCSGALRLRLSRARRDWHSGAMSDLAFRSAAAEILASGRLDATTS